jgi:hypothetical protein
MRKSFSKTSLFVVTLKIYMYETSVLKPLTR